MTCLICQVRSQPSTNQEAILRLRMEQQHSAEENLRSLLAQNTQLPEYINFDA